MSTFIFVAKIKSISDGPITEPEFFFNVGCFEENLVTFSFAARFDFQYLSIV